MELSKLAQVIAPPVYVSSRPDVEARAKNEEDSAYPPVARFLRKQGYDIDDETTEEDRDLLALYVSDEMERLAFSSSTSTTSNRSSSYSLSTEAHLIRRQTCSRRRLLPQS